MMIAMWILNDSKSPVILVYAITREYNQSLLQGSYGPVPCLLHLVRENALVLLLPL